MSTVPGFRVFQAPQTKEYASVGTFPLLLAPDADTKVSVAFLVENELRRKAVLHELGRRGAVLLRNVDLKTPDDFLALLQGLGAQFGSYRGGGGPRLQVCGPIHTSTETPAERVIGFHHELAYLTTYPRALAFHCVTPAAARGETPVCFSPEIVERVRKERPEFMSKLEKHGVVYRRLLKGESGPLQRSWQQAMETEDRSEAEAAAVASGAASVEWLEDGSMKVTSKPLPATIGNAWFNAIVLLHQGAQAKGTASPWGVFYGDMSDIADEDVQFVQQVMDENRVAIPYEQGDVLLVDNMVAMHARNSFVPPRLVHAAIISGWNDQV